MLWIVSLISRLRDVDSLPWWACADIDEGAASTSTHEEQEPLWPLQTRANASDRCQWPRRVSRRHWLVRRKDRLTYDAYVHSIFAARAHIPLLIAPNDLSHGDV